MELTNDQKVTLDQVMVKLRGSQYSSEFKPNFDFITIGGYAGTGKTFLISILRKEIYDNWKTKNVAFVSFTGKAVHVMKIKLNDSGSFFQEDFCGTIHSFIYRPEMKYDKKTKKMIIAKWIKKERDELRDLYDLIFVDEASMVSEMLWKDLLFYDIPMIAVGDHGQIPPVGDNFNLMSNPQFTLNEIKRQENGNPIIQLSQDIRMGKEIPYGFYDEKNKNIFKLPWNSEERKKVFEKINFRDDNLIMLCGMNKTRVMFNQMIRDKLKYKYPEPYPGERVVCLKNNHFIKISNGQLGTVSFLLHEAKDIYNMVIQMDGFSEPYGGIVHNCCFGKEQYGDSMLELQDKKYKKIIKESDYDCIDLFDFGYCISTHKSQGSEWDKVILIQERSYYWDDDFYKRWLYTACTRAKEKLFIIT